LGAFSAVASPLTLDWVSAGNNPVGYYYVSPYTAEIKSTGQLITLYCIDFNHEVAPPMEWEANIQTLDLADVPSLQYGNSSSNLNSIWVNYEAAAWLITQTSQTTDKHQQAIDQYAAWKIFLDPSHLTAYNNSVAAVGGTFAADITTAYNNAFSAVRNGYEPQGWDVVTPDPAGEPGSTQEFLTPVPTPEPTSIILLGTALVGVSFIVRMRSTRRRT
jgi:hypothetical protein